VRRITIVGSKKMIVLNDVENEQKIKIYDKGVDAPAYTDGFGEFQCSYRSGDIIIPKIRFVEPLRQECQVFIERCQVQQRELALASPRAFDETGVVIERANQECVIDSNCKVCFSDHSGTYSCGRSGLRVIKILEAAQRSILNGSRQEIIQW
jgi:hypothetical protein